ncbi:MAG TPA: FMN-binding protein [Vicinamibacteria bacterium]|nr:FMN-binding protein [Vicinamibacteria bacterium]
MLLGALAVLAAPSRSRAEVLMTEAAALRRACPGGAAERRILYLTADQVKEIEGAARSRLPSPIVTAFLCRAGGTVTARAVLDTSIVRTMPETVLTVVEPDGRLRMALVLQFGEPPDYLPRPGWLGTLEGKSFDDELAPGRDVRRVTGATLTVEALIASVRRALAIDRILLRARP